MNTTLTFSSVHYWAKLSCTILHVDAVGLVQVLTSQFQTTTMLLLKLLFWMLLSMSRVHNMHGRPADSWKSKAQQSVVPCTRISASVGQLLREHLDQGRLEFITSVELRLALGETACFRVHVLDDQQTVIDHNSTENSTKFAVSIVYAVEYLNLVHVHPIRQQYLFALPTINSVCVCDCAGGEDHCRPGHQYNNCTADTLLCVTSYHAHQKPVGCPSGAEADLCCQISVKPYRNWIFRALYIGQPTTVAKFAYRRYSINNNNDQTWTLETEQHLTVTLNEQSDFNIATDSLHFSLNGGLPHWQLKEGMYFHRHLQGPQQNANEKQRANDDDNNSNNTLQVGVPMNEPDEWDPNKLGWLRLENGHWIAHHGHLQLPTLQHVRVDDCKRQIYTVDYNARHSGGVGQPNFGTSVQENEPWIRRVRSQLNSVEIEHRRSPTVNVQVQINGTWPVNVSVSHRDSVLSDFDASIVVDSTNNRYLNLTLHNARGMFLGTVYKDKSSQIAELAFSLRTTDQSDNLHTVRLALPPAVNGTRRVCLEVNPETSVCRTANYVVQPTLKQPTLAMASWAVKQGECENCNQITLQSIGKYLNPLQWFDGIGDVSEMIALAIESLFSILVILVLLCLCRRFAWPILRLAIHPIGKNKSPGGI